MKVTATAKFVGTSSRKLQLVGGLVRGRRATEATALLQANPRRAAATLSKVLASAVANAVNNHSLKRGDLVIDSVLIGPGPTLKRFRPRSRGMASPVKHRSSHITVIVTDLAPKPARSTKPQEAKQPSSPAPKAAAKPVKTAAKKPAQRTAKKETK